MPPTTQQVLEGLLEMADHAPIQIGWKSIARSAANEIEKLRTERLKLKRRLRALEQGMIIVIILSGILGILSVKFHGG